MSYARNQRRRLEKVGKRYDEHGCSRCGSKMSIGTVNIVNETTPVCGDCLKPGDNVTSQMLEMAETSDGQADDRAWFKANPDAIWRLRAPKPAELWQIYCGGLYMKISMGLDGHIKAFADHAQNTHILTVKVAEGRRARIACTPPTGSDDEVREWVTEEMLPRALPQLEVDLPVYEAMTPQARFDVTNAGAYLSSAVGPSMAMKAAKKGIAMREARSATKQ